ncbi:MAG: bifunctional YncE family protein/alkaline phosphatase family protein [Candidatus Hydrogenedentes bacterium]|nr:bifunctional YncE family protein/alkaline phosphatase family protein [Candidatus Hydrogenedentota bacterium]
MTRKRSCVRASVVLSVVLCVVLASIAGAQQPDFLMTAPAGDRYVELDLSGTTVLPNGRLITPTGELYRTDPHPYGLTLSANGRWVVTANSNGPVKLSILDLEADGGPKMYSLPEDTADTHDGVLDAVFMGLQTDPSGRTLYVSGGEDWSLSAFDLETREMLFRMSCDHVVDGVRFRNGYLGDMRLSKDGKLAYAVDQSNFRMLVIDVIKQEVVTSIPVGRYPFGIVLSPDGKRAYIANVGMYEYAYITDERGRKARLNFPPFGVPSKEAEEGVVIDGKTVPGLGDANDIRGMSVFTISLSRKTSPKVIGKTNTGHLVGEQLEDFPAVGGSSPNSLVATETRVYVSNGSNDSITVIDAKSGDRLEDIDITLDPRLDRWRGMIPFGLALSPDHETLYVAEAGINAVGVIRLRDRRILGHIPVAWFPSKLAVSSDGKTLYVANAKGIGSGPNHGPGHAPGDPTGIDRLMRGYVSVLQLPETQDALNEMTRRVIDNSVRFVPASDDPRRPGHPVPPKRGLWKSPIKHILYVVKENRTYDEIYGAMPGGRGDAELCRLGRPIDVTNREGTRTVKDVLLMPNHIALAERFAMSDNFYCDSDNSIDGHRWLVGTYPNEFMEARNRADALGKGPGNFMFIGSSGAIYPEDYNEAGSIWEHFERGGISYRNYGLGFEFKPQEEPKEAKYTGIRLPINYPMPKTLFDNTSREYATYNMNIPDQFRMDMFEREFRERWLSGKEEFPQVITMMLPNDHGARERPDDGYPFWGSFMSDNDLALGRLVELISNSPFWESTAIIVMEDDAQGYRDTVDAHRSICLVISPYTKRNYVSHRHISIASILKTIFLILDLPPLNQYDAFASDLADYFDDEASNAAPYTALPVNPEIFDPEKALDPFDDDFDWDKHSTFVPLDHQPFLDSDEYGHSGTTGHGRRETM